jgi:2-amino-4-hydroxy-6-hydroxymethyldihydropteridine diphosphokinase
MQIFIADDRYLPRMKMNLAYLLIGGNMGQREENLEQARCLLQEQCGDIQAASAIYETAAWGKEDQAAFLNQALGLVTPLNARQLMRRILKAEKQMGRIRKEKFGPRIIDIDILLFNQEIHDYPLLRLPHPELQNRRFALVPLAEIAPDYVHPVFKKNITQLLAECGDLLEVKKITD